MLEDYFEVTIVSVAKVKQKGNNKGNKNFKLWLQLMGTQTEEEMEEVANKRVLMKVVVEEMKRF